MRFDLTAFIEQVHDNIDTTLSLEEISTILNLADDRYNIGETSTLGNRLLLNRIIIDGKKDNGQEFSYDKKLYSGLNLWVADNFKGKSTIFKAIKLALTGKNDLSGQMKKWLRQVTLEFSVSGSIYTIYIHLESKSIKSRIFEGNLSGSNVLEPIAEHDTLHDFKEYIQDFFFDKLSFYPLRKVQANQHSVDLKDADASWALYFTAIYVQSKDYNILSFANNHGGIFQVLMGLPYTYAIYALDAREKKLKRELDLLKTENNTENKESANNEKIGRELVEINTKINDLRSNSTRTEIDNTQQDINSTLSILQRLRIQRSAEEQKNYELLHKHRMLDETIEWKKAGVDDVNKEIRKLKKSINVQKEYIDSGIFFSNLEVTECPHCEHILGDEKIKKEKDEHKCMLCNQPLEQDNSDVAAWKERISDSEKELLDFESLKQKKTSELLQLIDQKRSLPTPTADQNEIDSLDKQISILRQQISDLEEKLAQLLNSSSTNYFSDLESLLKQKLKLESDLANTITDEQVESGPSLTDKIDILNTAKKILTDRRRSEIEERLKSLEELMLKQAYGLGLKSYTRIEINPENFVIYYYQNDVKNSFSDISEGEQLRAKLALYLSMIEMDLAQNLGKHPRLIILDSPSKEEGDANFVQGLKEAIRHIDDTFGNQVQLLIGTANRNLEDIITDGNKKVVVPAEQYLF